MTDKRIAIFDVLKFFAIFLVVWGHCIQYFQSEEHYNQLVYRVIYSFHMPLFMALVGFFATSLSNLPLNKIIQKKFIQLILPSITAGTIMWVIFIRELSFHILFGLLTKNLWFLKSAFFCCVIYSISFKINSQRCKIFYLISCMFLSQAISLYSLCIMFPSFIFGVILHKGYNDFKSWSKLVCVVSGIIFVILQFNWDSTNWKHENAGIVLKLYYRLYRIIIGVIGTTFFISLFESLKKSILSTKIGLLASIYGKYTMGIYILQTIFVEILLPPYINMDGTNFYFFNFVYTPAISLSVILVCVILVKVLMKNKFAAFLLLGKQVKV
ncbi:MAG: acyltransferase family protein [Bacteroides sp.]|nr:acyltransferase family protein [Bacteroides sp.]MCM1379645.1 acyltransferase family protein [Bacteroides sp.]MCM1445973.1 acyltransferase family protein [Prevotella sp.]